MAEVNETLEFESDEVASSWEFLSENSIKNEITGLITRGTNLSTLLEKMVYANDYDKTSKEYDRFWMDDLGTAGWVTTFYNTNLSTFREFKNINNAPPWYSTLSPEKKKAFDASQKYFADAGLLIKIMADMRKVMMKIKLRDAFRFMRITLNLDEAGFSEDMYHKIDQDVQEVGRLINLNWDTMENSAGLSRRFYSSNSSSMSKDQLLNGYRKEKIRDYQIAVEAARLNDHFTARSDGTFTVNSAFLAEMRILDKYTAELTTLRNIEDDMKSTLEACPVINESIHLAWKEASTTHFKALLDTLEKLNRTLMDFCEGGLNVWNCYKNRDTDAPYCFVRVLPAFSKFSGKYEFYPRSSDPWHDGTEFEDIYRCAAKSLSEHCYDFVYRHGYTG